MAFALHVPSLAWQVRGLHTYGVQQHAIYANRCFATTIASNYIEGMGSEGAAGAGTGIRQPQFALLAAYLVHFAPLPIQKHVLRAIDDRFFTAGTTICVCI